MKIITCDNFYKRFKGYMFTTKIDKILCFPKCNCIHTFFMLKPIDVIMTDKNHKILYIYTNLKPWKIIWPKKNVYYTYETPVNTYQFKINSIFKIKEQ